MDAKEDTVLELARRLARKLGTQGPASIQVNYDDRGRVSMIECRKRWTVQELTELGA